VKDKNKHISLYIAFAFHGKKYLYIVVLIFGILQVRKNENKRISKVT